VVQVHSGIGCTERQRQVLRSLGLRGPQHARSLPDVPSVRGMVAAIPHLVRIAEPAAAPRTGRRKA
jgi:large subunit ribosomal protein L30